MIKGNLIQTRFHYVRIKFKVGLFRKVDISNVGLFILYGMVDEKSIMLSPDIELLSLLLVFA